MTITKYEGARAADGLFEGTGQAQFMSGNKYSGDFERGQMHGHGEYVWTDGLVYTGSFVNNKITGTGVCRLIQPLSECMQQVVHQNTSSCQH